MITVQDLIDDEYEAIDGYNNYLKEPQTKKVISIIKKIITDEQKHIKILKRLK